MAKHTCFWLLPCYMLLIPTAFALDENRYFMPGAEVGLTIETQRWALSAAGTSSTQKLEQLTVFGYESPYTFLQGGLQVGLVQLTQSNLAATEGATLSGKFGGIQLRNPRPAGEGWHWHLLTGYRYYSLDDKTEDQSNKMHWHQLDVELGARFNTRYLELIAGGYYTRMGGTLSSSGTIRKNRTLSSADNGGMFVSIGYFLTPTGVISLSGSSGAREAISLQFSHYY